MSTNVSDSGREQEWDRVARQHEAQRAPTEIEVESAGETACDLTRAMQKIRSISAQYPRRTFCLKELHYRF